MRNNIKISYYSIFSNRQIYYGDPNYDPLKTISDLTFLLVELTNRNKANLPDKMDVNHAARGLVKLWSTYRYVQNIIDD